MSPLLRSFCLALIVVSMGIAAPIAAFGAGAPDAAQVATLFPQLVQPQAPELDTYDLAPSSAGMSNVAALRGQPGMFVFTQTGEPLLDENGHPLDWTPTLVGAPSGDGRVLTAYGQLSIPASGSNAPLLVGDDALSSAGFRLVGRAAVAGVVDGSVVSYEGAVSGATEVVEVAPDGLEQWLVVGSPAAGLVHEYDLVLPTGGSARERSDDFGHWIELLDSNGEPVATITAPRAIDRAGREYAAVLELVGPTRFSVRVQGAENAAYPVAIDPHLKRISGAVHTWQASFCGAYSENVRDFNTATPEDKRITETCPVDNASTLLQAGSSGKFEVSTSPTTGIRLALNDDKSYGAGNSYTAKVVAPVGAGIVDSNFRGHVEPAPNQYFTCQVRVDPYFDRSLELDSGAAPDGYETTYRPPAGSAAATDRLLFAGSPAGGGPVGNRRWAQFPMDPPYADVPTGGAQHMRAYLALRPLPEAQRAAVWEDFDASGHPNRIARWLEFGIDGTHLLPDRSYYPYAWLKDIRQPADNQALLHTAGVSTSYSDTNATRSMPLSYAVDRVDPTGTAQAVSTGSPGARRITVNGSVEDVEPSPSTNPTTKLWTAIRKMVVTIDRISGGSGPGNVVTEDPASCTGGAVKTCSYSSAILDAGAVYHVLAYAIDGVGNHGAVVNTQITIPTESTTQPGYLDTTFGTSGIVTTEVGTAGGDANDSTRLPNGDILSIGTSRPVTNGDSKLVLTSHTPTGQLDTAFGTNGIVALVPSGMHHMEGYSVATDSDGQIITGGVAYSASYASQLAVGRLDPDGTPDTSFSGDGFALLAQPSGGRIIPTSIVEDAAGRIVVGGYELNSNTLALARFNADGTVDTSFDGDGQAFFTAPGGGVMEQTGGSIALQSDGMILIGGNQIASGVRSVAVARVLDSGSIDASYGTSGWYLGTPDGQQGSVRKLIVDESDRLLLALNCGSGCGLGIARLTTGGVLDGTFGSGGDGATYTASVGSADVPIVATARDIDMVRTSDGKWVVVGQADQQANSGDEIAVGRFNADGTTDTTFGNQGYNVTAVAGSVVKTVSVIQLTAGDVIVTATSIPSTGNHTFLLAAYQT